MTSKVILVLSASPNVGLHIIKHFSAAGYKTAGVSRNPSSKLKVATDLALAGDFADLGCIKGIFEEVKAKLGAPSIVVYNGDFLLSFTYPN